MIYIPYVYKWTQLSTGMWYIGSRTKKGVNPFNDDKYFTSSKIVAKLIKENPKDWKKSIMCVGTTKEFIIMKETEFLTLANAKNDKMSYNQHNGDGLFVVKYISPESRLKMATAKKGRSTWNKGVPCSDETKEKIRKSLLGRAPVNKGVKMTEEQRQKMIGKKHSEERKENMSKSLKGRTPWNKGLKTSKKTK
jgi:hypothetical protein